MLDGGVDERRSPATREILAELSEIGPCLPGSLVSHTRTCSTPGCHCHDDPSALHGPYRAWMRQEAGHQVTRTLSTEQAERLRPLVAADRRLRQLVRTGNPWRSARSRTCSVSGELLS